MHPTHLNRNGLIAAVTFALTWATTGVTVRSLPALSPISVAAFRCSFAFLALLPFLLLTSYRYSLSLRAIWGDVNSWILSLIMVGYYFLVIYAYQLAPVAEIALINGCTPVFVLIYQKIVGDKVPGNEFAGTLSALCGLLLIVLPNIWANEDYSTNHSLGILIGLSSSISIAAYAVFYRRLELKGRAPDQSSLTLSVLIIGMILFWLVAWFQMASMEAPMPISRYHLLLLISLGIVSTAIPTMGYSISSRLLPPVITTSFRLVTPIAAALLAYIVLGEVPSKWVIPGGILIIFGLVLMVVFRKRR